jgi:acetyltransferase-like isoleucine patch superfamily enzyme
MFNNLKRLATGVLGFVLPSRFAAVAMRCLGHRIALDANIGFSLLLVERLVMRPGTRIGHGNLVRVRRLVLDNGARIGRGNLLNGPMSVLLKSQAEIGNRNKVLRGPMPTVTYGPATLKLGESSKITSDHRIDCTQSVVFGCDTILAGSGSQLWTHGYVHVQQGGGRYRVDGAIVIGNGVYIGSASIVTTGVRIGDDIIVGAGTTVARSLDEPGMYVSAAMRRVDRPVDPTTRSDLARVVAPGLCEPVYIKTIDR